MPDLHLLLESELDKSLTLPEVQGALHSDPTLTSIYKMGVWKGVSLMLALQKELH